MKKSLLLAGAAALAATSATAQSTTKFVETIDSVNIYNIMIENSPGREKMKSVPRFALIGKDNKFYLGFGANLKMVGDFDWGNPLDNANEFHPSDIVAVPEGNRGKTQFSVGQSNFYLNFVALPGTGNQLGVYIDINFMGADAKAVALHHAYLKYRGITAGYVISTFTDAAAEPFAIDFAGPNAITFVRNPSISYTFNFGKDKLWSAAIGADMPMLSKENIAVEDNYVSQRVPDIPFYIQRSWASGKGWLRASAIFRDMQYRNVVDNKNGSAIGWGVKLSGKTPIVGGLSAYYQAVYGKGIASYINDLGGQGLDLVSSPTAGKMEGVKAWGAYGTLRYDFSSKVFMNATYSQVRAYTPWAMQDSYKMGQYVTSNLVYNINSWASCGVEYIWGQRENVDGTHHHDNRVMLMLQVSI